MLNLIKAELYRTFHRKYTFVLLLGGAACAILLPVLFLSLRLTGSLNPSATGGEILVLCLPTLCFFAYVAILMLADCVFSDEYKHATLKNAVSYGVTRTRIYFAKLAAELILALLELVAVFVVFGIFCFLLLGTGTPEVFTEWLRLAGLKLVQAFPIWLAGLAIANFFYFLTRGGVAVLGYLGVIVVLPFVIAEFLTHFYVWAQKLVPYLMYTHIMQSPGGPGFGSSISTSWILGPIWAAVAVLAGCLLFRRREIK